VVAVVTAATAEPVISKPLALWRDMVVVRYMEVRPAALAVMGVVADISATVAELVVTHKAGLEVEVPVVILPEAAILAKAEPHQTVAAVQVARHIRQHTEQVAVVALAYKDKVLAATDTIHHGTAPDLQGAVATVAAAALEVITVKIRGAVAEKVPIISSAEHTAAVAVDRERRGHQALVTAALAEFVLFGAQDNLQQSDPLQLPVRFRPQTLEIYNATLYQVVG
jgi:hypothetical protein